MKAHRTDRVSLTFALIFLAIAGCWLVAGFVELPRPRIGWLLAGALILIGLLGVLGALRVGRVATPAPVEPVTGPPGTAGTPAAEPEPPVVEPQPRMVEPEGSGPGGWQPARPEPGRE